MKILYDNKILFISILIIAIIIIYIIYKYKYKYNNKNKNINNISINEYFGVLTDTSATYTYTNTVESWTVPDNVTQATFTVIGGKGGTGIGNSSGAGGFGTKITNILNVTKGQIYRGDSRKAVVFACIYHAYKIAGKCQTPKNLMETFGLNKKNSLKGLKIVNVNAPKDSPLHTTILTAVHHIHDVMDKFSATPSQKAEVIDLYRKTKNRSSKLNRARPQSVAAALTYYWICKKKMDISLKKFAQKADLSELTINKNAKEVAIVLGTPKIV